jgi:cobalt-zinc-cadmium efflux system protein
MRVHHHDVASNAIEARRDRRFVLIALCLISGFFIAELITAILGNALVLFADAGHMLTDVVALALSAWAIRLASSPAQERWTYGLKRAEILAAAANAITLAAIAVLIGAEAIHRLIAPQHVAGELVFVVAIVGAAVNLLATGVLARADRRSLNLRAAYAHVVTDLYAFGGTAVAGLVIVFAHWRRADSVAALLVGVLMITTAWDLLRASVRILLQGTPEDLDLGDVRQRLIAVDHVLDVHDLHAWTLTSGSTTLSAHVIVENECFDTGHAPQILDSLQVCVLEQFGVSHATFQLEPPTHASHEDDIHS